MTGHRKTKAGGVCVALVGTTLICAGGAFGADGSEVRRRGLDRFAFPRAGDQAIPQCVKAPALNAPPETEPVGVWANDVAEFPAWACFSAEEPPSLEVQAAVNSFMQRFTDRYQAATRWSGAVGTPRTLTWSFVPDGLSISSGIGEPVANSNLFAQMDAKFGGIANRAVWIAQFQACFDRWAALTGMTYTFVSNAGNMWDDGAVWGSAGSSTPGAIRGDVRISMKPIDGVNNVLAYNSFPSNGDMVIDSAENWGSTTNTYRFLRNTVLHEHGHGLGLNHECPILGSRLMEPFLNTSFDGPQEDDLRAITRQYGDAYESNDILATATPIGALSVGATLNPSTVPSPAIAAGSLTGISTDGDRDYYSMTTTSPVLATITVTPLGTTYQDYTQAAGGSCNTGVANTNALTQANLTLEALGSSGTVMRTASSAAIGLAEQLTGVLISAGGNVVRVGESDAPTQSQLYTLTVTGVSGTTLAATDNTFFDRVDVTWTTITGAASYQVLRNTTNDRLTATVIGTPATPSFSDTTAVPGTTYFYWANAVFGAEAVWAAGPDQGTRQNAGPANDACASAETVISGGTYAGSLAAATNDGTASCGTSSTNPDVWYAFTAGACGGTLSVSTCGTNDTGSVDGGIDTVVSILTGCGGTELVCNDDAVPACAGDAGLIRDSLASVALTPGQSVLIRVSKFSTSSVGGFTLNVSFSVANDSCASATPVSAGASNAFCNDGATTDGPTETACNFFGNNTITGDLWYTYVPTSNGRFNVSTCGTATFDTKIAVYAGACPGGPDTAIACSDDNCSTQTTVSAIGTSGQTYRIRLGGFNGAVGSGSFRVYCAGDYNQSGSVTVQDIFDFLAGYFAANPNADINGANGVTVQDIFDFLAAYFIAC